MGVHPLAVIIVALVFHFAGPEWGWGVTVLVLAGSAVANAD